MDLLLNLFIYIQCPQFGISITFFCYCLRFPTRTADEYLLTIAIDRIEFHCQDRNNLRHCNEANGLSLNIYNINLTLSWNYISLQQKELFDSRTARITENRTVPRVISGWVKDKKYHSPCRNMPTQRRFWILGSKSLTLNRPNGKG